MTVKNRNRATKRHSLSFGFDCESTLYLFVHAVSMKNKFFDYIVKGYPLNDVCLRETI